MKERKNMESKKKKINVLSIDFDYFQNVTKNILSDCYPDGIDLSTELSIITWASHYNNQRVGKQLKKVGILHNELEYLKQILLSDYIADHAEVMITNSHKFIYPLIHELMDQNTNQCVHCVNVDLHHDFKNDNDEVDCGNWISHLCLEYGNDFTFDWVVNPISRTMYGLDEAKYDKAFLTSLADIQNQQFDVVFLCRSDNWFAPHLDKHFDEIVRLIAGKFYDIRIEESVSKVRDYQKYDKHFCELINERNKTSND